MSADVLFCDVFFSEKIIYHLLFSGEKEACVTFSFDEQENKPLWPEGIVTWSTAVVTCHTTARNHLKSF